MPSFDSNRRRVLAGLAATSALATVSLPLRAHEPSRDGSFRHGVASGDPDARSVVLWTRITAEGEQQVSWQLSEDQDFTQIRAEGIAQTNPECDHTVKVLAQNLDSGKSYYYRFKFNDELSPVGRTRTLPIGELDRLGIALVSCSNYAFGYFNAYDAIASDASVDFVLHTGDYIYEYAADGWGGETARKLGRIHQPANEIVSLGDYRRRHAQYKTDAGSLAMHAAHPLLACWDDHESANNPWKSGAQNHQPATEGDWATRRAASIRAYYEWMPVREPEWLGVNGRSRAQFWRAYSFGNLALLHTLETRHTARDKQIDYTSFEELADETHSVVMKAVDAPGREMLSQELQNSLSEALRASVSAGQPWRLIGNPMPIARTFVPDVVGLGVIPDPNASDQASGAAKTLAWKGRNNLPFYPDTWDGYGWARERLYDLSRQAGASDLVFLTGDSHSFWLNKLADSEGRPAGIELGTAGVSSPGDFVESGFGKETAAALDRVFAEWNPEIVWTDNLHQGYVRLELSPERADANFIAVDTVHSPQYRTFVLKRRGILPKQDGSLTLES